MSLPRISSQVDTDFRHYEFQRNSRIPRGSFDQPQPWGDRFVFVVMAIAVLCFALGVFE
jgi:hypothetical protein